MKKFLTAFIAIIIAITFLLTNDVYSQWQKMPKGYNVQQFKKDIPKLLGANNVGKDFWCTFHPCFESYGTGNKLYIYISSGAKTIVTIEVPGKGYFIQKPTIPNDIIAFEIDPSIGQPYRRPDTQAPEAERIYNGAGMHIYADQPIIVYGVSRFSYTSDSYLALPVSSLGKEYICASWPDIADDGLTFGQYLTSYTEVVAAYDQTKVRFTLGGTNGTVTAGGQKPGQTTSWTLYKGDVLMFGSLGPLADLTGSKWSATKPVACFSGSYGAYVPENNGYWDFLMEEELPTNTWGTQYHYTPIAGRLRNSIVRIFAKENNTTIYRDGQKLAFIKYAGGVKGDGWLSMRADNTTSPPRAIVFSADKPFNMTQYNTGQTDDGVVSDPFQLVLTPLEQYQREIIFNTPGIKGGKGFNINWINIVFRTKDDGTMPDDLMFAQVQGGNFVWKSINSFSPDPGYPYPILVNGHHYACKQLLLPGDGVYKIKANDPFCAYAYGFSPYDSYGHPTSVALGDLERPDTLAPHPTWYMACDGTLYYDKSESRDPFVEDWPQNADRSNLSMINMDPELSYNYKFSYKDFVPGEDASTSWHAEVIDKTQEARLVVTFSDRRGNDTTTIDIIYIPHKFAIRPDLDFGLLSKGDVVTKKVWLVNETLSDSIVEIDKFRLLKDTAGFEIVGVTLPFFLLPHDSVQIEIRFTATENGEFMDSVGVGDSCVFAYKSQVKAKVGSPIITVSDWDFGDVPVNSNAPAGQITIANKGSVALTITGYSLPTLPVFTTDLRDITPQAPLVLNPGQKYNYNVYFTPTMDISYLDSMIFASNTAKVPSADSVAVLKGRGIIASLVANSYDWGRKLIDRPNFPAGPYDARAGDRIIVLNNYGSLAVNINGLVIVTDTLGTAFEFNRAALTNIQIPDSSELYVPVKFHPTQTGYHVLEFTYDNSAGSTTKTKLEGTGIVPRLETSDVDFGTTEVGDIAHPNTKLVRYTNKSDADWAYGDVAHITDFGVQPNGNEIATNAVTFGTEGFRYDKSKLTFPITLAQGEYIEFPADFVAPTPNNHVASLSSVSDAETEVTSNWKGFGKLLGVSSTGGAITLCNGSSGDIICHVGNVGTDQVGVTSIAIVPEDPQSTGLFNFKDPNDANPFTLPIGAVRDITITYTAKMSGNQVVTTHKAWVKVYYLKNGVDQVDSCELTGNTEFFTRKLIAKDPSWNKDAIIGSRIPVSIQLVSTTADNIKDANINTLFVSINYNGSIFKVEPNSILVGSRLQNDWQIQNPVITDNPGVITVELVSRNPIVFDYNDGELLNVMFDTYLPKINNPDSIINVSMTTNNNACVAISSMQDTITLKPTCEYSLRKVAINSTNFSLASVNPNPVVNKTAVINFGVGLDVYTEIKIVNTTGDVIAIPVQEKLKPGSYSVDLDVSNLSNGVYWYEMVSGPFRKLEKMVINR